MGRANKLRFRLKARPDKIDFRAVNWYKNANKLIRELYPNNWELFADLLAAISPRVSVKKNWKFAIDIMDNYLDRENRSDKLGDSLAKLMPAQLINTIRALQRRPIKGPKVSRFAANLKGLLSDVTIDVWICRAYNIDQKKLTELQYKKLEKLIRKQAKVIGLKPAEYQAVIWTMIRRLSGLKSKSFKSVYNEIFCETPFLPFKE